LYTSTNTYITLLATIKKFKQKKPYPQQPDPVGREKNRSESKIYRPELPKTAKPGASGSYARPATKSGRNTPISAREMTGAAGSGTGARARPETSSCRSETASTSAETGGIRSEIAGSQGGSSSGVGGLEEEKGGGWTAARGVRMDKVSRSTVKAHFLFFLHNI